MHTFAFVGEEHLTFFFGYQKQANGKRSFKFVLVPGEISSLSYSAKVKFWKK
jgi:hypothetical protein